MQGAVPKFRCAHRRCCSVGCLSGPAPCAQHADPMREGQRTLRAVEHAPSTLDMNYKMSHARSDAASRPSANLSKGYSAVFATVFIWSVPSLFMFYLNRYYDPWAQNFYRYSVACIAIAPLLLYQIRRGGPRIDMHAVKLCLLPCLPNVVHQVTQVMALFYIGPGV